MAIGYRATLTLPAASDATALVEAQLRSWLREKRQRTPGIFAIADWAGPGVHKLGPGAELVVVHDDTFADGVRRRYHLTEANSGRIWGVTISVLDVTALAGRSDTVVIEAELEDASTAEAVGTVSTPRVVEYILSVAEASNGRTRLNSSPEAIGLSRLDEVLEAIRDDTRSSAVIVAASISAASDQDWTSVVAGLTRQSRGLATTYLISDSAVSRFNAALPVSHRIPRGAVRTFAPGVDFTSTEDGRRHPILTPDTVSSSLQDGRVADALQRRHASTIRSRALMQALPRDVRRGLELLARQELDLSRQAETERRVASSAPLVEAPPQVPAPAVAPHESEVSPVPPVAHKEPATVPASAAAALWPPRLSALTGTWLGRDDQTDDAIEHLHEYIKHQVNAQDVAVEQLEDAAEREAVLEEQIEAMQQRLEALELDAAVDAERARESERLVRAYQGRIRGEHPAQDLAVPPASAPWTVPKSVTELVLRLAPGAAPISERVIFTGNPDLAATLDVRDQVGRFAGHFWDYACVLFDYAELKSRGEISGSVQSYLVSTRLPGRRCAPERHVERKFAPPHGDQRGHESQMQAVPKTVSLSGQVPLGAYFRPTHSDSTAPLMYYYDDVLGSGFVYVGYIGPGLTDAN